MSALRTHEVCPANVATAPEPGLPDGETRTSCSMSRLSSDADMRSCRRGHGVKKSLQRTVGYLRTCESADHARERTAIAWEV